MSKAKPKPKPKQPVQESALVNDSQAVRTTSNVLPLSLVGCPACLPGLAVLGRNSAIVLVPINGDITAENTCVFYRQEGDLVGPIPVGELAGKVFGKFAYPDNPRQVENILISSLEERRAESCWLQPSYQVRAEEE